MKKVALAIIISLFGGLTVGLMPATAPVVLAQKKDDRKKDRPGPVVQREKKGDSRPKEPPPKKDRRP